MKNIKKIVSIYIIMILFALTIPVNVLAQSIISNEEYIISGDGNLITLEQLLRLYRDSSEDYNNVSISYEIETLNYDIAKETLNKLNQQYKELTALEGTGIDVSSSKAQIKSSIAEINLELDTKELYKRNELELISIDKQKLEVNFMKQVYALLINLEQKELLKSNKSYLNLLYKTEEIKYKKGYITLSDLEEIKAKLRKLDADILANSNEYESLRDFINQETNQTKDNTIGIKLSVTKENYNEADKIRFFDAKVYDTELLNYTNKALYNYIDNESLTELQKKKILLQISSNNLKKSQIQTNIKTFVKKGIKEYNSIIEYFEASKLTLDNKNKKYKESQAKYKKGLITQLELSEVLLEKQSVQLEYYQYYYKAIMWKYILDNGLYGIYP